MKKVLIVLGLTWLLVLSCGCGQSVEFCPALEVVGDVNQALEFTMTDNDFALQSVEYAGNKYQAYSLRDILDKAQLKNPQSQIYLVAADGMMASLNYQDIAENHIAFTEKGWEALNADFPPSGDVKEIKRIVVADGSANPEYALRITKADGTVQSLTCGQLLTANREIISYKEGTNEKNGNSVTVFTANEGYYIPDLLGVNADSLVTLTDSDGKAAFYYADGYIVAAGNSLSYVSSDHKDKVDNLRALSVGNE